MIKKLVIQIILTISVILFAFHSRVLAENNIPLEKYLSLVDQLIENGSYEQALNIIEIKNSSLLSNNERFEISIRKGTLYWMVGNPAKALEYFLRARTYMERINVLNQTDTNEICIKIINLYFDAKKRRSMSQYLEAISSFREAIVLSKKINRKEFEMKCLRQMSLVFLDINDLGQFLSYNEQGLAFARDLRHRKEEGYFLNNIGLYYYKTDQYLKALQYIEEAMKIAIEENNNRSQSECLTNIGAIYRNIGDYDMALKYFQKSLKINRSLDEKEYIYIDINNISTIYRKIWFESGKREYLIKALSYLKECDELLPFTMHHSSKILLKYNLGLLYADNREYHKAFELYQEAMKISEKTLFKEGMSYLFNGMGTVSTIIGKDNEALEYYQKAIAIAAEIDNSQVLWNTLCEMADLKKKQGNFDEALKCYEYAMNVIEKSRSSIGDEDLKAGFLGSNRRLAAFHGAIDLLYQKSRKGNASDAAAKAFGYIERAKARGFMDSLEIGRVSAAQPVDPVTENKMKTLQARLSRLSRQLGEPPPSIEERRIAEKEALRLEEDYEKLRRDLRLLDPRFAEVRFPDLITIEQLKSSLPDDRTVVLTYALGQESAYGLAIDRKGQRLFPLPAPQDLRELVGRHLKWVSDPERKPEETAVDLYRTLIAPGIEGPCLRMLIVPDDVLHYLPFETIRPPAGSPWLGAETEIAYAPSLSSLAEIGKRADKRRTPRLEFIAVAAADSEAEEDQMSFRYRAEEVDEISKLFRPGKFVLLKGIEAGEANLKRSPLADARIIHFAAHGTIDEQKPVRSAIILGDETGSDEDGRFQAREVYDLRLNAGLVVLSSCRSAAGKLLRGEGIIGLNRAFLYAGASAVMMSLWPVDDEATRHLMSRFYIHLKDGYTASASLRLAKTEMIESTHFSHPYFWAGFVVAGAADRRLAPGFASWRAVTLVAAFLIGVAVFLAIRRNRKNKF